MGSQAGKLPPPDAGLANVVGKWVKIQSNSRESSATLVITAGGTLTHIERQYPKTTKVECEGRV